MALQTAGGRGCHVHRQRRGPRRRHLRPPLSESSTRERRVTNALDRCWIVARFRVRALTRDPGGFGGPAYEVVAADLTRPETLSSAFEGAHGVFLVTNFWEPGTNEMGNARNAVAAATSVGVRHFVWSTLPDVEAISGGAYDVPQIAQ